ncbi:MAG TPA: hypothetical protein ENN97_08800 [Phycisphaerales bacterium]|nr:hypothetical protein [Phycisphaerales bacterium]
MTSNQNKHDSASADSAVEAFVRGLDDKYRMLVILKSQLYGGRWEPMLEDLQNRLEGKPYIFKLANRIKDDVDRIAVLRAFEQTHNVDLADYIKLDSH